MVIYMHIEGVSGTVTDPGHENWIEISSLAFGVGRGIVSSSPGNQSNREASTPSFTEIRVEKVMDETSPTLFVLACIGKATKVEIHLCEPTTRAANQVYTTYVVSDVLISNYTVNVDGGSRPRENLSFNFSRFETKFIPYGADGQAGTPVPGGYDLVSGQKV